jgi:hypothetical protein
MTVAPFLDDVYVQCWANDEVETTGYFPTESRASSHIEVLAENSNSTPTLQRTNTSTLYSSLYKQIFKYEYIFSKKQMDS